jgi:hypothetical protein
VFYLDDILILGTTYDECLHNVHNVCELLWEAIATRLNTVFSSEEKTVELKGRGCKNRMELLLAKYKAEDARNLKRFAKYVKHTELNL